MGLVEEFIGRDRGVGQIGRDSRIGTFSQFHKHNSLHKDFIENKKL
jgi:hypothetical protein